MAFLKQKIEIGVEEAELKAVKTFSSFSKPAKWIFVILTIAILPGYFISRTISEKYWEKKYQAQHFAAKPSFETAGAPEISELTFKLLPDGKYSAWAKISNPNFDLSLANAGYQFKFYNSQNKEIFSYPAKLQTFFLLPGQNKYLTVAPFSVSERIADKKLIFDQNLHWQKRLFIPKINFSYSTVQISQQRVPQALAAEGYYVNNSPYILKDVVITIKLYDLQNTLLDVSQRLDHAIAASGRRGYKFQWPEFTGRDPGEFKAEITVDTNTLDPKNFSVAGD